MTGTGPRPEMCSGRAVRPGGYDLLPLRLSRASHFSGMSMARDENQLGRRAQAYLPGTGDTVILEAVPPV